MIYRSTMWLVCLCMLIMSGCMSTSRFSTTSNDYQVARNQIAEGEKDRDALLRVIELSKKARQECLDCQMDLKRQLAKMDAENNALMQKIQALDQTVKNNETVISIQETVIRLFDDSNQTLQKSIKEQIASQQLAVSTAPAQAN